MAAADKSGVDQIAASSPLGYQMSVGERGAGLSSGQAQRIAVARLLLGNPLIVILDEATNALDPTSRTEIESLIDRCFADRTRLFISHHDENSTVDATLRLAGGRMSYPGRA
jgi:ABC-type bacteriocin/lantibiotic exporter with double-glycine peptidase domain